MQKEKTIPVDNPANIWIAINKLGEKILGTAKQYIAKTNKIKGIQSDEPNRLAKLLAEK